MAELDITRVDKIYHSRKGDVHAVKALDLVVKPGELVALEVALLDWGSLRDCPGEREALLEGDRVREGRPAVVP